GLFQNCCSICEKDLMFCRCENLTSLDVSRFDTQKIKSFVSVFGSCKKLKSIDVSSWNTENALSMYGMFMDCESLETIDLSGFDIPELEPYYDEISIFTGCDMLQEIKCPLHLTEDILLPETLSSEENLWEIEGVSGVYYKTLPKNLNESVVLRLL
ncbi:MAG: BspA family leucine-rich repeat surface protein, partial [Lachnospiraceae bacterium]|nr:BspA family leucine-rich repeat surface protein [Lachnospiraceae bacterium]